MMLSTYIQNICHKSSFQTIYIFWGRKMKSFFRSIRQLKVLSFMEKKHQFSRDKIMFHIYKRYNAS